MDLIALIGTTEVVPFHKTQGWVSVIPPFAKNAKDGAPRFVEQGLK